MKDSKQQYGIFEQVEFLNEIGTAASLALIGGLALLYTWASLPPKIVRQFNAYLRKNPNIKKFDSSIKPCESIKFDELNNYIKLNKDLQEYCRYNQNCNAFVIRSKSNNIIAYAIFEPGFKNAYYCKILEEKYSADQNIRNYIRAKFEMNADVAGPGLHAIIGSEIKNMQSIENKSSNVKNMNSSDLKKHYADLEKVFNEIYNIFISNLKKSKDFNKLKIEKSDIYHNTYKDSKAKFELVINYEYNDLEDPTSLLYYCYNEAHHACIDKAKSMGFALVDEDDDAQGWPFFELNNSKKYPNIRIVAQSHNDFYIRIESEIDIAATKSAPDDND